MRTVPAVDRWTAPRPFNARPLSSFRHAECPSNPCRRDVKSPHVNKKIAVCGKAAAARLDCGRYGGPMHRKTWTSQQWANRSLLRRLAALEEAHAAGANVPPERIDTRRKRASAAFALGFTTAVLIGAIALVILSLASPQSARADAHPPMLKRAVFEPPGLLHEASIPTTRMLAPSVELWSGPRELWWGFPKANR
jgi:hypothetical protein